MLTYDLIKKLCKKKGVTVTGTEKTLGFARGSLCKIETNKPSFERIQKLADYFDVSVEFLMSGGKTENNTSYYLNDETAQIAQEIFENKELRILFDASRKASPEDLKALQTMAFALKRKERGNDDDFGC